MFKDARQLDRQRTATSFDKAAERYAATSETWFNGSVGSVDRRLAACDKLAHSIRFTVARLSINDSQRYLEAAEGLDSDRRALLALRDDLLTGASNREDVNGPPGWRTAKPFSMPGATAGSNELEKPAPRTKTPRWMDDSFEPHVPRAVQADAGFDNRMPYPPSNMDESLKPVYQNAIDAGEDPLQAVQLHVGSTRVAHWFKDDGSYIVPNDGGPHPRDYSSPHEYIQARNMHDWIGRSHQMAPGAGDHAVGPHDQSSGGGRLQWAAHEPKWDDAAGDWAVPTLGEDQTGAVGEGFEPVRPIGGALNSPDRRWVTLEAAKFVAANTDTVDDSLELATRAQHHAAMKTSTFTTQRSAAVCEAFVEEVTSLGRRSVRPPVRTAAHPNVDFDDQVMYLL